MPLEPIVIYRGSALKSQECALPRAGSFPHASKLDELVRRARLIIFETQTKFPYTFFPNKLTICPNRVTVSYGSPFFKNELPIMVESLTGAEVSQGFKFATLSIETFGIQKPEPLRYMTRRTHGLQGAIYWHLLNVKRIRNRSYWSTHRDFKKKAKKNWQSLQMNN